MPPDVDAIAEAVVQAIDTALAPVLQRLAVTETRVEAIGDLRDRVAAVEVRAALPPDLTDVRDRLLTLETRAVPGMADLQAQLAALEARAAAPVVPPADEMSPDEMAASLAGLLRKELADVETPAPVVKMRRRIVRDSTGGFTMTDEPAES